MNTLQIPERNIMIKFPASWDELNDEQFAFVMQNWLKLMDEKINPDEFRILVLYHLLGIKRSPFQDWKDRKLSQRQLQDKFSNIWQLMETLNWIIRIEQTENGPAGMLNYTGTTNRIPKIESEWGWSILEGPENCMLNVTFGEYRHAWKYFDAYTRDRKNSDLDHLIAILYRPVRANYNELKHQPDFDGQNREPFNPYITSHYAELVKDIPFWMKYTIYLWFGNCDRFLKEEELELEGKSLSFSRLFKKGSTNHHQEDNEWETLDENELGLTGLLYMIAESKLFGDPSQVDRTAYIDVLTALLYWKQQADKVKGA